MSQLSLLERLFVHLDLRFGVPPPELRRYSSFCSLPRSPEVPRRPLGLRLLRGYQQRLLGRPYAGSVGRREAELVGAHLERGLKER